MTVSPIQLYAGGGHVERYVERVFKKDTALSDRVQRLHCLRFVYEFTAQNQLRFAEGWAAWACGSWRCSMGT